MVSTPFSLPNRAAMCELRNQISELSFDSYIMFIYIMKSEK